LFASTGGEATAVARLHGVARQLVHTWIREWRVERFIDALILARASGIPVERLAGEAFKTGDHSCRKIARPISRA